jgi:hypothetical protein
MWIVELALSVWGFVLLYAILEKWHPTQDGTFYLVKWDN